MYFIFLLPFSFLWGQEIADTSSDVCLINLGWEYSADGKCETMPSTRSLNVKIKALLCFEQGRMIWIWPENDPPAATLSFLLCYDLLNSNSCRGLKSLPLEFQLFILQNMFDFLALQLFSFKLQIDDSHGTSGGIWTTFRLSFGSSTCSFN